VFFLISYVVYLYAKAKGIELTSNYDTLYSATNVLIAFGICGICRRLNKLIDKK
jgi:hypothetical protein